MKKEEFAEILSDIDENYIHEAGTMKRSEKPGWRKWSAMAACLCLIVASTFVIPRITAPSGTGVPVPNPDGTIQREDEPDVYPNHPILRPGDEGYIDPGVEPDENPRAPWTIHFNKADAILSAQRPYIKGVFTEPLNDMQLDALIPGGDLTCSGYARFDNYGNLLDVVMQAATTLPESPVTISLADYSFGFDYVLPEEVASVCNGVEYIVCQYEAGDTVTLFARTMISGVYFQFAMDVSRSDLEQAKEDFQHVLECFAYYEEGGPDLSVIVPKEIPELMEQMFNTLSEARAEPDFGRYMPCELPAGFGDATIYRFRFQDSNFLSALWSRGLDDLFWVVEPYTQEAAHRITSVNEKENYDLSLYPIPRADCVPDELREIVDNPVFKAEELTLEAVYCRAYQINDAGDTDGWRMRFGVKYGDVIVSVSTKGVEPEWLYQQLMAIKGF